MTGYLPDDDARGKKTVVLGWRVASEAAGGELPGVGPGTEPLGERPGPCCDFGSWAHFACFVAGLAGGYLGRPLLNWAAAATRLWWKCNAQ